MDLVDEENVVLLQVREDRGQIAGLLDYRPGRRLQVRAHLVRHDDAERGLSETGRAVEQHVIERLAALESGLDEDLQILGHLLLTDVLTEPLWSETELVITLLRTQRDTFDERVSRVITHTPNYRRSVDL